MNNIATILIIDDDDKDRQDFSKYFLTNGYLVDVAIHSDDAKSILKENPYKYDVLFIDDNMPDSEGNPDSSGRRLGDFLTVNYPYIPKVMLTGFNDAQRGFEAKGFGFEHFINKDNAFASFKTEEFKKLFSKLLYISREKKEIHQYFANTDDIDKIFVGKNPSIIEIKKNLKKIAVTDANVLITGENGTGKEIIAKAIHSNSKRKDQLYVEVNCAAIPNELIESELFGHEIGSFTGATKRRIGRFELANNGTIFLDEIGEMSLQAQAKVLRVTEYGDIEPVGAAKSSMVDVRIVSATNKNLIEEKEKNNFREDLFHRLNVIPLNIPPLRERKDDIPLLLKHFSSDITKHYNKPLVEFDSDAVIVMQSYAWPGNVREFRNTIERIIILSDNRTITKRDVENQLKQSSNYHKEDLNSTLKKLEAEERVKSKYLVPTKDELEEAEEIIQSLELILISLSNKANRYISIIDKNMINKEAKLLFNDGKDIKGCFRGNSTTMIEYIFNYNTEKYNWRKRKKTDNKGYANAIYQLLVKTDKKDRYPKSISFLLSTQVRPFVGILS